jgi:hypothetical protein
MLVGLSHGEPNKQHDGSEKRQLADRYQKYSGTRLGRFSHFSHLPYHVIIPEHQDREEDKVYEIGRNALVATGIDRPQHGQ